MRFRFNRDKALQVMARMVQRLGSVEKLKLMKLVYLADKAHFLLSGYPITGDTQHALPYGPVPSATLNVLNGDGGPDALTVYEFLHVDDNRVSFRAMPAAGELTPEEAATVDSVLATFGNHSTRRILDFAHELPEYKEAYRQAIDAGRGSAPIPYRSILRHAGDEQHFRFGRPVVSDATLDYLVCPYAPGDDADL